MDLRSEFQEIWSSKKAARLDRRLSEAFLDLVEGRRLYEILKMERRPGAVRLTLANMWRLIRLEDPRGLLFHTFDLAEGRWREQVPEGITWRKREHGSRRPNSGESIWPDLDDSYLCLESSPALFKNIIAAWLANVRRALNGLIKPSLAPGEEERFAGFMFQRLVRLPSKYYSEAIHSALSRHIWGQATFPQLSERQRQLSRQLAAQSADLARISRESPNILPLLNLIPPASWPRRDLLQDQVLRAVIPVFKNFSPAGLRWLRRAPTETLASFCRYFEKFKCHWATDERPETAREVAELMAALPPQATERPEVAETVMDCSLRLLHKISANRPYRPPVRERLLRLQARHIMARWDLSENPKDDLEEIKEEVAEEGEDILDWFNNEGHRLGLPDKNSTWRSLKRRSDKWHEHFRRAELRENFREALAGNENTAWESLLGQTVIEGIKITPLITGLDLYNESLEMRHCVVAYAPRCLYEGWRVFSLREADGTRSTLSLKPQSNGLAIDQHKGPDNRPVSPAAAQAAREVCRLYNRKYREAAETALTGAAA